ncbi:MAG: hypothetical protein A0129_09335 [Limnobacter sp. CACIAM 66H1]|uniref:hypothetical protein n=1 Tax=Limnobacter sp. CACIAM 66H1 TaxID=1813033 RepID=UPI0007A8D70C|nr:hypothetical protein [Limnobacter sp. CACIAM 66H1]KYP11123.1 MAG: hypothetical protein A0129_09335 [Limnobacter sp. CACIAM 66H1]
MEIEQESDLKQIGRVAGWLIFENLQMYQTFRMLPERSVFLLPENRFWVDVSNFLTLEDQPFYSMQHDLYLKVVCPPVFALALETIEGFSLNKNPQYLSHVLDHCLGMVGLKNKQVSHE